MTFISSPAQNRSKTSLSVHSLCFPSALMRCDGHTKAQHISTVHNLLSVDIQMHLCYHHCVVQSLSCVWIFAAPWTAARRASLSITNSRSSPKPMSIESVMPSNHLILCHPLLLPPSIFPSIRVFSNESVLHIRWPKYWSFSFSISPANEYSGLISFRMDWLDLLAVQGTLKSLFYTIVQKHQFFCAQLSL